jgi:hypothetical protein
MASAAAEEYKEPRPMTEVLSEKKVGYQVNRMAFDRLPIPSTLKVALIEAHSLGLLDENTDYAKLVDQYGIPDLPKVGEFGIHSIEESEKYLDKALDKADAHVPPDPSLLD